MAKGDLRRDIMVTGLIFPQPIRAGNFLANLGHAFVKNYRLEKQSGKNIR